MSLAQARESGATLYLLPPTSAVGPALLALESVEVPIVVPRGVRRAWLELVRRGVLTRRALVRQRRLVTEAALQGAIALLSVELRRRMLPENIRDRARGWRTALAARLREIRHPGGESLYFRRRLIRTAVATRLPDALDRRAREEARGLGVPDDAPVVCVHARESGFKEGGREVHEKQRRLGKRRVRDDTARNASITAYGPVLANLVSRGFTVVRIGDPSMTLAEVPGVVDLTRSEARSSLLEVHLLLRSRFLMAGESGPASVAYLTNTPVLVVNATDPIGSYPIRASGLLLLKRVTECETDRRLSVDDMLSERYLSHLRDTSVYEYSDNTPEELQAAVDEMLVLLDGDPDDDRQRAFRTAAAHVAATVVPALRYLRKWRADDGFLGDGRLARVTWSTA
jgi:putative glycosyltransferase (TIGR04372 family)